MMTVNTKTLQQLLQIYCEDHEALEMIEDALMSFSAYWAAIYKAQTWMHVYSAKSVDAQVYRDTVTEQDAQRTVCHNAVLANVRVLNRMAEANGLEPFYDGLVSEERPYRRQVADAILSYAEDVIKARI